MQIWYTEAGQSRQLAKWAIIISKYIAKELHAIVCQSVPTSEVALVQKEIARRLHFTFLTA